MTESTYKTAMTFSRAYVAVNTRKSTIAMYA